LPAWCFRPLTPEAGRCRVRSRAPMSRQVAAGSASRSASLVRWHARRCPRRASVPFEDRQGDRLQPPPRIGIDAEVPQLLIDRGPQALARGVALDRSTMAMRDEPAKVRRERLVKEQEGRVALALEDVLAKEPSIDHGATCTTVRGHAIDLARASDRGQRRRARGAAIDVLGDRAGRSPRETWRWIDQRSASRSACPVRRMSWRTCDLTVSSLSRSAVAM